MEPSEALKTVLRYITTLRPGKVETFGIAQPGKKLTTASKAHPKVHLALQFILRNYFRLSNVTAVRLGHCIQRTGDSTGTQRSVLIHYKTDDDPRFHYYRSAQVALDIKAITGDSRSRIIQCLIDEKQRYNFDDDQLIAQEMMPLHTAPGPSHTEPEEESSSEDEEVEAERTDHHLELPPIPEEDDEDTLVSVWYQELLSGETLEDATIPEAEVPPHPICTMPAQTVCVTGNGSVHHQTWYVEDLGDLSNGADTNDFHRYTLEKDDVGYYVSLDIDVMMTAAFLDEGQTVGEGEILTLRVYTTVAAKKAVVVKDDDLLTKKEMQMHHR